MKAISILQPWAALIVCGAKDVENRTWTTKHRGPIAICAGSRHDKDAVIAASLVAGAGHGAEAINAAPPHLFFRGGLVGVVDLVDIVKDSASPWAIAGCYHWILANPRPLPFVAVKGRLQLFDVEVAL